MKKILILLAIIIPLISSAQSPTMWNNFGWDTTYVSGDEDQYLNIQIGDWIWQIGRPFYDPAYFSATWYLSPTGSDSDPGTYEEPFKTLDKLWTVIGEGDTAYLRGGTYEFNDQQVLTGADGTSSDTIKVFAYPGETPVLTSSSGYSHPGAVNSAKPLILMTADYTWWKGITIADYAQASAQTDGYNGMYVRSGSDHNVFEQLIVRNCGSGFYIRGNSDQNLVLNCDFYSNKDPYSGTPYGNADGLAIAWNTDVSDTNRVQGCRFWWNSDDGIDLFNNDGFVYVDSCWSWHNGYVTPTWAAGADGNGFKLGDQAAGSSTDTSRYLTNCISFNNKQSGYAENDMDERTVIYNSVSYRDGVIHGTFGSGFEFTGIIANVIKNCVEYEGRVGVDINTTTYVEYNDWDIVLTIDDDDFVSLDTLLLDNARLSGGWLPNINFMFPASGSDLIDAGLDVGLPFIGGDPDVGVWESDY